MTAPEVWTVTDPDGGWEVYTPNASGGYRLVSHQGGTAVVDTLPDGAEAMVAVPEVEFLARRLWETGTLAHVDLWELVEPEVQGSLMAQAAVLIADGWTLGGDRRG